MEFSLHTKKIKGEIAMIIKQKKLSFCERFGQIYLSANAFNRLRTSLFVTIALTFGFTVLPVAAQEPGEPVELALPAPMGSLKTVPVTEELLFILRNPGVLPVPRRDSTVALPDLKVHPLNINPLTSLELTYTVEEVCEDGECEDEQEVSHNIDFSSGVGVSVGLPAAVAASGPLLGRAGPAGEEGQLRIFINEEDFIADRDAAVVLGKALFWDMQIGSDGVQACGSCHFHAGVDNRTRGQLNPDIMGPDGNNATLDLKGPDQEVTAADFPFHKLFDITIPGEPLLNPGNVISDTDDVMSSMGVSRFKRFDDIPPIGLAYFLPAVNGVQALAPDVGTILADPVPANEGFRRVEPRHTPNFFAATFNFDNFWDGRARHDFNGGSVDGAADPQEHVFFNDGSPGGVIDGATNGDIAGLRQAEFGLSTNGDNTETEGEDLPLRIRLSSMASLATGPVLSNFEMSFDGRNWPKMGKKLLQSGVTPLANQLVATDDSVLGPYSNQGGSACTVATVPGKPGLCISYEDLIAMAFYPNYWANTDHHLIGTGFEKTCTTRPVFGEGELPVGCDPFDGYVLSEPMVGAATPTDTDQFRQIEANMSMFFGLGVQAWTHTLIPDDTPFDRFMDLNPNESLGIVVDGNPGMDGIQPFPLVGGLDTRQLHGFDLFTGSNHSGLNPEFKSARCGQCHNGPEMTDHSNDADHAFLLIDPVSLLPKVISGYFLEDESGETAQDAVEIDNLSFDAFTGLPTGHTLLDNGIYNIGVTPIANDIMRGGNDNFGFPLSNSAVALYNAGCTVGASPPVCTQITEIIFLEEPDSAGVDIPAGVELVFDPLLPDYYLEFANEFTVGEGWPMIDRTVFLPDSIEDINGVSIPLMGALPTGTFPNANRVGRMGNAKAPSLRNVELTGPYFHNGGQLTLRQVVDFYGRGGDFPATNAEHLDPHILRLNDNISSGGSLTEADKVALVDFLLALTDDRVKHESAPFDHPEIFVPIVQDAPENIAGRSALMADTTSFRQVPEVGYLGGPALGNFLGVSSMEGSPGVDHFDSASTTTLGDRPVARDDSATVKHNVSTSISVLSNDYDLDGKLNKSFVQIVQDPAEGTATGGSKANYTPNPGFTGFDEFRYAFLDKNGNPSNVATVRVLVEADKADKPPKPPKPPKDK
jgi:cytochrome c peroxidase